MTITTNWQIDPQITIEADRELNNFPPLFRQLFFNRGYATEESARFFLKAQAPFNTSPWQLEGMARAVDRIVIAVESNELIIIYGDFDVDGVTATALMVNVIGKLGGIVEPYIPNRFDEGYGLNNEALEKIHRDGCNLVITVDCGIRSNEVVKHAGDIGLDIIISDHHNPGKVLPEAYALINPKQQDDLYPDKDLAGVGVAYKIAEALLEKFPESDLKINELLDLVVLGTVADLAPLTGENRWLVRKGLRQLQQTTRQGLFSLANVAGLDLKRCNAGNIGYILGPRLNASGRMESALASYELLVTQDIQIAGQLAQELEIHNRERQQITRETIEKAKKLITNQVQNDYLLFAADPDFNSGVVGLAASKLSEKYYKPAIVCTIEEETTRGSCRSIPEFHITEALDQCTDILVRHGGHAAAAGFTVTNENAGELEERLKCIAKEKLESLDLRPTFCADMEIPLSELNEKVLEQLEWFEPTGYGNPQAVFVSRNVQVLSKRTVGKTSSHLKLVVSDGYSKFDAIGFNLGHLYTNLTSTIDMMFTFEMNEFNGRKSLQLNLLDIKLAY